MLLSLIYSDTDDKEGQGEETFFGALEAEGHSRTKAINPKIQYIFRGEQFNLTAGAAYYYVDRDRNTRINLGW